MADSKFKAPTHRWSDLQKLGLLPQVSSLDEYDQLTIIGALHAEEYLKDFAPNCFLLDVATPVHKLIFGEVHPWAGQFRSPGEAVILGGYPAADPWRIVRELQLLEIQTDLFPNNIPASLSAAQRRAALCAFHHIRFERIHPFRDGNGRVGRVLLGGGIRQFWEGDLAFPWADLRDVYFQALREGNKGNLALLANVILETLGEGEQLEALKSPFRVAPRMFESVVETDIQDDFNWSLNPR